VDGRFTPAQQCRKSSALWIAESQAQQCRKGSALWIARDVARLDAKQQLTESVSDCPIYC